MVTSSGTVHIEQSLGFRTLLRERAAISILMDSRLLDREGIRRIRTTGRRHRRRVISPVYESNVSIVVDGPPKVEITPKIRNGDDRELQPLRGVDRHDSNPLGIPRDVGFSLAGVDLGLSVDTVE